jgi:ferredoxin
VDVCPVDCIHETSRMLVIDPIECIDCGACLPECPVEAIFPADELPPQWAGFESVNAAWADGAPAVETAIDAVVPPGS